MRDKILEPKYKPDQVVYLSPYTYLKIRDVLYNYQSKKIVYNGLMGSTVGKEQMIYGVQENELYLTPDLAKSALS